MSLLLDALKKAAQEKQNADTANSRAEPEAGLSLEPDAALSLQQQSDNVPAHTKVQDEQELELELDVDSQGPSYSAKNEMRPYDGGYSGNSVNGHRATPTPSTITDEALQILIHKTNKEYKKYRLFTWGGVFIGALLLLSISGLYFYYDMMEEIESMQRKHQIALVALKSKTKIEENLTSLAVSPDTNKQAVQESKQENKADKSNNLPANELSKSASSQHSGETFSVQRTEKRDPVSEALEQGWLAYQSKDYKSSKLEYEKVLDEEPNNHDALLGIAAIALQQGDMESAKEIYIKLLERDPRNPHAHAGLANIAQTGGANLSETRLKQLIEYRPDDSHLQFALGNLYVQKKSWPEAQRAFFNAWKVDNKNPDYAYNLAVSLDQLGKHKQAKTYYENSLKLAPGKNISFSPEAVKNRLAYLGADL